MKFGIIGYGSIGKRHVRNLVALGYKDIVLLRKIGQGNEFNLSEFSELKSFLETQLDAVIISTPTSLHAKYLQTILAQNMNVLVEKPLVATLEEWRKLQKHLESYEGIGMTAYNMRFHPCVKDAHKLISSEELGKIYSARFFVGQYLPDWRPGMDYSKSYSASLEMGGGVLFDLIHEIDLASFLVGEPAGRINARVEKISDLQIKTEDLVELLYQTKEKSMVSIHLDYLTRGYKRYIEVVGKQGNLHADLCTNEVLITSSQGEINTKSFHEFSKNTMYRDMLQSFIGCIKENRKPEISLENGMISNRIAIDIRERV